MDAIEKLLNISTAALAGPADAEECVALGALGELLARRNGFFAFESALHVLSLDDGAENIRTWNDPTTWRSAYGELAPRGVAFAQDVFGNQFIFTGAAISLFDAETGDTEVVASTISEWCSILLEDFEFRTGQPLAHSWQLEHGPIPSGARLVPRTPFVLGGEYVVSNLVAQNTRKALIFRGDLAQRIRNLPDGAKIEFKIVD